MSPGRGSGARSFVASYADDYVREAVDLRPVTRRHYNRRIELLDDRGAIDSRARTQVVPLVDGRTHPMLVTKDGFPVLLRLGFMLLRMFARQLRLGDGPDGGDLELVDLDRRLVTPVGVLPLVLFVEPGG